MGKRKREKDVDYKSIAKKIRRLERKLRKRKRSSSSSLLRNNSISPLPSNTQDGDEDMQLVVNDDNIMNVVEATNVTAPVNPEILEPTQVSDEVTPVPPDLDQNLLEILGSDPSIQKNYDKDIQPDLATRLQYILVNGLEKDSRVALQEKYLPPANCILVDAPTLNAEIKAAVPELILKRDKGIEIKQKVLGSAISCIAQAVTLLMSKENKDNEVLKLLMDGSRLLCDCQHTESNLRRNFMLSSLKKDMKEQLQGTKVDKLLFGSDLAETIKTAKSICKSGAELKQLQNNKPPARKDPALPAASSSQRTNLNWKAPPLRGRQRGTQRKEPVSRPQRGSAYRSSYRQQPTSSGVRSRNRH